MTQIIAGLGDVADRYDVLLSDIWGVIHNGEAAFAAACEALATWRQTRGPVVLISNSPRPSAEVISQLEALGVPRAAWSTIVTSGDATRVLLSQRAPGPAWKIGPERDEPLYAGLGLSFAALEEAAFIACTGPFDDEVETPEDYRASLTKAADRGLEMVCANPDKVVQRGDRLIYCGGALADLYQTLGGLVIMAGKPFAPIYDLALTLAKQELTMPLSAERVLAIGDGVATDIRGANLRGLDVLFVAKGIHGEDAVGPDGRLDPVAVEALLTADEAHARFVTHDLAW